MVFIFSRYWSKSIIRSPLAGDLQIKKNFNFIWPESLQFAKQRSFQSKKLAHPEREWPSTMRAGENPALRNELARQYNLLNRGQTSQNISLYLEIIPVFYWIFPDVFPYFFTRNLRVKSTFYKEKAPKKAIFTPFWPVFHCFSVFWPIKWQLFHPQSHF